MALSFNRKFSLWITAFATLSEICRGRPKKLSSEVCQSVNSLLCKLGIWNFNYRVYHVAVSGLLTSVMLRHPYFRYRRDRTRPRLCLCTLCMCIVGITETKNFVFFDCGRDCGNKNLCVDCGSPSVRVRSNNG